MKNKLISIILSTFLIVFVAGCSPATNTPKVNTQQLTSVKQEDKKPAEYYKEKIENATYIKIEERTFSFGKKFEVFIDKEKVATIKGKSVKFMSGDVLTMTDGSGNFIVKEEECKRWFGFEDRAAEIKDQSNNIIGYIGEDKISDLFNVGWKFHFYDINKNEIGYSEQVNLLSAFKSNKVYNKNKELLYEVESDFTLKGNDYTLIVHKVGDKNVNVYNELLMICIEDAIHEASKDK